MVGQVLKDDTHPVLFVTAAPVKRGPELRSVAVGNTCVAYFQRETRIRLVHEVGSQLESDAGGGRIRAEEYSLNGLRPADLRERAAGYSKTLIVDAAIAPVAAGVDKGLDELVGKFIHGAAGLEELGEIKQRHLAACIALERIAAGKCIHAGHLHLIFPLLIGVLARRTQDYLPGFGGETLQPAINRVRHGFAVHHQRRNSVARTTLVTRLGHLKRHFSRIGRDTEFIHKLLHLTYFL